MGVGSGAAESVGAARTGGADVGRIWKGEARDVRRMDRETTTTACGCRDVGGRVCGECGRSYPPYPYRAPRFAFRVVLKACGPLCAANLRDALHEDDGGGCCCCCCGGACVYGWGRGCLGNWGHQRRGGRREATSARGHGRHGWQRQHLAGGRPSADALAQASSRGSKRRSRRAVG